MSKKLLKVIIRVELKISLKGLTSLGIGNQLQICINKKNLQEAKEKVYMMLENKLGLKEKRKDIVDIEGKYDIDCVEELNNTSWINFENSSSSPKHVLIIIKAVEADTCINLYNSLKEAVKGL